MTRRVADRAARMTDPSHKLMFFFQNPSFFYDRAQKPKTRELCRLVVFTLGLNIIKMFIPFRVWGYVMACDIKMTNRLIILNPVEWFDRVGVMGCHSVRSSHNGSVVPCLGLCWFAWTREVHCHSCIFFTHFPHFMMNAFTKSACSLYLVSNFLQPIWYVIFESFCQVFCVV